MQAVRGSGATEYSRGNSTISDIVSVAVARQSCCSPGSTRDKRLTAFLALQFLKRFFVETRSL